MKGDRNRLRSHIRAARNWLGQAENSLADEKDVQCDLKLMLAKAELQHAEERRGRGASLIKKLLPVATAGAIAAAIFLLHGGDDTANEENVYRPVVTSPSREPPSAAAPLPDAAAASADAAAHTPAPPDDANDIGVRIAEEPLSEMQPIPSQEYERREPDAIRPIEAERARVASEPPVTEQPSGAVPSKDMQKLMQSAGKILREK